MSPTDPREPRDLAPASAEADEIATRRAHLRASLIGLVGERGTTELEFDELLPVAGVAAAEFFACFDNFGECLDRTVAETTASLCIGLSADFASERSWRAGLRAALEGLISRLAADEDLARFLVVLSTSRAECAVAHCEELNAALADLIETGADDPEVSETYPRIFAETIAGGVRASLIGVLRKEGPRHAAGLLPDLIYLIVRPYAGVEIADQELARPGSLADGAEADDATA